MENCELYIPTPDEITSKLRQNTPEKASKLLNTEILELLNTRTIRVNNIIKLPENITINLHNIFGGYCYLDASWVCKSLFDKYRAKGYIIEAIFLETVCDEENQVSEYNIRFKKFEWIDKRNLFAPPSYEDSLKEEQDISNTKAKIASI